VLITADTEKQLQHAVRKVARLLVPMDEEQNDHKRKQLRELALINGTLRDKTWLAPEVEERNWKPAAVKCEHCGETSHPSLDCPFKGTEIEAEYQKQKAKIDAEYMSFLDEVGVGPAPPPEAKKQKALNDYEDFMNELGVDTQMVPHAQPQQQQRPPVVLPPQFQSQPPPQFQSQPQPFVLPPSNQYNRPESQNQFQPAQYKPPPPTQFQQQPQQFFNNNFPAPTWR